jgi:hypothetical protein
MSHSLTNSFVALVVLLGVGCDPPEPSSPSPTPAATTTQPPANEAAKVFVGAVEGSDMRVGVVLENGKAAIFFCGGATTLPKTKWYRGAYKFPEPLSITAAAPSTASVSGTLTADEATGTVKLEDATSPEQSWRATVVSGQSIAGLYESKESDGIAGLVLSADESAQGAFIRSNQPKVEVTQIIVFRPLDIIDQRVKVRVLDRDIFMSRVRL